jgi:hypothetical protein
VYAYRNGVNVYSFVTGSSGPTYPGTSLFPGAATYPGTSSVVSSSVVDTPLPLVDGSVTDSPGNGGTQVGGVRRTLTATFADGDGSLYDLLSPAGTELHPWVSVLLTDGTSIDVPMGVFDVDTQKATYGGGQLQITAPDRYARLQRKRFLRPQQSRVGWPITYQITDLIWQALGYDTPVLNYSRAQGVVTNLIWDDDRAKPIEDLAAAAGVYVYFDRYGYACIRDLPTLADSSVWLVDASPTGVLVPQGSERSRSRRGTANVVRVIGDSADALGPNFPPVIVWDSDPASPTYAGPDPESEPELAGPFGVVVYNYTSSTIQDAGTALTTAKAILAKTTGLPSQVNLTAARHPGLDAFDVIDVLPPRQGPSAPLTVDRHLIDSVTHPLTPSGTQTLTGRSTRTDSYGNS